VIEPTLVIIFGRVRFPHRCSLSTLVRPTKGDEDAENQKHRSLTLAARNEGTRYRAATVRESVPLGLASSTERYHELSTFVHAPLRSRFGCICQHPVWFRLCRVRESVPLICSEDRLNAGGFNQTTRFIERRCIWKWAD
jgi:hypothetical protein